MITFEFLVSLYLAVGFTMGVFAFKSTYGASSGRVLVGGSRVWIMLPLNVVLYMALWPVEVVGVGILRCRRAWVRGACMRIIKGALPPMTRAQWRALRVVVNSADFEQAVIEGRPVRFVLHHLEVVGVRMDLSAIDRLAQELTCDCAECREQRGEG